MRALQRLGSFIFQVFLSHSPSLGSCPLLEIFYRQTFIFGFIGLEESSRKFRQISFECDIKNIYVCVSCNYINDGREECWGLID